MAFTGTATIVHVSDSCVRITGLSLGIGAAGTIGLLTGGASEVDLNVPTWDRYTNGRGDVINLDSSVKCDVISADAAGTATEDIAVVKTGTVPSDLVITLTNKDAAASGALEIFVTFMGG